MKDYCYKVNRVVKVIDGDTVDVELSLGFGLSTYQRIRISGIDASEIRSKDQEEKAHGLEAKAFSQEWFSRPGDLFVETRKSDKFGRYLGTFTRGLEDFSEVILNEGLAVPYHGGKRGV